jgi:hypothetical protein
MLSDLVPPAGALLDPSISHLRLRWDLSWVLFMAAATGVFWYRLVTVLRTMFKPGRCAISDLASTGQLLRAGICLLILSYIVPT